MTACQVRETFWANRRSFIGSWNRIISSSTGMWLSTALAAILQATVGAGMKPVVPECMTALLSGVMGLVVEVFVGMTDACKQ
jgi:hypothetical protein